MTRFRKTTVRQKVIIFIRNSVTLLSRISIIFASGIKSRKKMEKKTFTVNGMKCVHCKANVERAIRALSGVASAEVSLEDKSVVVEYDASAVNPEAIKNAVDASGHYEMEL